jgi:hypothetical protein
VYACGKTIQAEEKLMKGASEMGSSQLTQRSEKNLRYIKMTMAMEGMSLTERDTADVRDCLCGKVSAEEKIKQLVSQYTVKEIK